MISVARPNLCTSMIQERDKKLSIFVIVKNKVASSLLTKMSSGYMHICQLIRSKIKKVKHKQF